MNTFVIKKYTTPGFSKVYQVTVKPGPPDPSRPTPPGRAVPPARGPPAPGTPGPDAPLGAVSVSFPFPSPSPSPGSRREHVHGVEPVQRAWRRAASAPTKASRPMRFAASGAPPAGTTPPRTARDARAFFFSETLEAPRSLDSERAEPNALAPCGALWRRACSFRTGPEHPAQERNRVRRRRALRRAQVRGEQRLRRRRGRQARQALGRERLGRAPPRRRARPRGGLRPGRHGAVHRGQARARRREERRGSDAKSASACAPARRRRRGGDAGPPSSAANGGEPESAREGLWNMPRFRRST